MKTKTRIWGIGIVCALVLFGLTPQAKATFMVDPDPGGAFFYIDAANKDVASFSGQVGGQSTGVFVDVEAVANVDTGNGYANVKPAPAVTGHGDQILTSLLFTPRDPYLFSDFSFRAQLLAAGGVFITVWDAQENAPQIFSFLDRKDTDFTRIGIVSSDGETIKSVEILSDGFKEVKQINFSGEGVTNVPEPTTMLLLGLGLVGLAGVGRKMK